MALQLLGAILCAAVGLRVALASRALGTLATGISTLLLVLAAIAGGVPAAGRIFFACDAYPLVEPGWKIVTV